MNDRFSLLRHLWNVGVESVSGRRSVAGALKDDGPFAATVLVAVGKAACSMFLGAQPCVSPATRSIIVSKYGHLDAACGASAAARVFEAGHPVPDGNSLAAGAAILQAVEDAGPRDRLLLLVSGGASSLAEVLPAGHALDELQAVTRDLLGSGKPIGEINAARGAISRIKGGRLLGRFRGGGARVYALSDVQGDWLADIGGGIGDPCRAPSGVAARVVASNALARRAAANEAERLGLPVRVNEESLYKELPAVAGEIAERITGGSPGIYIWGGEPTVELPPRPGKGGRNQSLALAVAGHIRGARGISLLVAGTDGTDGPTDYAGAYVDGETVGDAGEADSALRNADAGTFLDRRRRLFKSGPTNTNVMDLVIGKVG